jgi:SAM-dependent methyltransferase
LGRLSEHYEATSGAAAREARALGTAINELASVAESRLSNLQTKVEQHLKAVDATLSGLSSALDDSGSAISQIQTLIGEIERSSSDRVGALEARLAIAATKEDLERIASDIRRRVVEAKAEAQAHVQEVLQRATEEINGLGRKLEEHVRTSVNESSDAKSQLSALSAKAENLAAAHGTLLARLAPMQAHLETLVPFPSVVVAAQKSIDVLAQQQTRMDSVVNSLNAAGSETKKLHSKLRADLEALRVTIEEGKGNLLGHEERLASHEQILGEHKASLHGHGAVLSLAEQARVKEAENMRALDPLYAAFEDQFRGDPRLVRARAEPYLSIVTDAGMGTADAPVLDLGCGRGEWLELIRENGLVGRGIDNNQVFVQICRGRGLEVIEGDVIQAMAELPAMSIGAITGMHIAEHLPFEVLVRLLDEARRLLVRGGILALETPNPENLQVATKLFYMDPTHRNPLLPEALKWLVSARGFEGARIERWTIARDMEAPPLLDASLPGAESINAMLAQMAVAPDYSIIARRGGA